MKEKLKNASFCYLLLLTSSQWNEHNNISWLPFNILHSLKQNFISEKTKLKRWKFVFGIKNTGLLPVKIKTFPSRLHHRTWMTAWHMHTSVDRVTHVSVSCLLLALKILCKNDNTSQVKCHQKPLWFVSVFSVWWGKIHPWKIFRGACSIWL